MICVGVSSSKLGNDLSLPIPSALFNFTWLFVLTFESIFCKLGFSIYPIISGFVAIVSEICVLFDSLMPCVVSDSFVILRCSETLTSLSICLLIFSFVISFISLSRVIGFNGFIFSGLK